MPGVIEKLPFNPGEIMKAVILAADVGSRLGRPFPKCMSLLPDGEQILGRQIRLFHEVGIREISPKDKAWLDDMPAGNELL